MSVQLKINGTVHDLDVEDDAPLLWVIRDEVGLTPKLYSRIERFQHVLRSVELCDEVDWVGVATSCGYFDQAHFIHDFREFTGLRPSDYLGLRIAGQRSHVRVPD